MELIAMAPVAETEATRTKKYSFSIRVWHWLNAVIITGSLLTVMINSSLMNAWTNTSLITDRLKEKGVQITEDQARSVAFALSDKVWAVHTYLGYALAGLFLFRLMLEFFELADQRLIRKIKAARQSFLSRQEDRISLRNEMLIKTLYAVFYGLLMVMVITGLCLAFREAAPILGKMHFIKEIHGFTMYLIIGFIVVHIAGVLIGERKGHKGIVSEMINGGQLPE
jgi:Ni,Fe-hydrogenase I cytochrome b subunit